MSEDVPYLYHHNTDLLYIAGITEPGALLLAEKGVSETSFSLFVSPRDKSKELWEGPLCGTGDEVRHYFGVDDVLETSQFANYIARAVSEVSAFHFDGRINPTITTLLRTLDAGTQESLVRKWGQTPPKQFLAEERLVKSDAEVALLRRSAEVMSLSLNETMAQCSDTMEERAIEARLEYFCKTNGANRMAFPCVVAGGRNGTVLHYMANDSIACVGDLVMVDSGCQVHGYCSDVSRTFPIGGKFSGPQKDLYTLCLDVQKKIIDTVRPGVSLDELHVHSVKMIAEGLMDLGFWKNMRLEEVLERGLYAEYYPHAVGHYLGLDVHDTHAISKSRPLEKGMVVTVEPGIYCRSAVHEGFEDIGIRIEDDVVVTADGCEVLSNAVKDVADIEARMKE